MILEQRLNEAQHQLIPAVRQERLIEHILKERNDLMMNVPKNNPIAVFQMFKKLWETTWGKMMPNAYLQALQIRGKGQIKYSKIRVERQKQKDSKVSFGKLRGYLRILGYLWICSIILAMFLPGLLMSYIRE